MEKEVRGQSLESKGNKISWFVSMAALCLLSLASGLWPLTSFSQTVATDSRIKTFVYNPNEVFTITTHYGYQSNIEFGPKEAIDTISVGDRVAWQIIPAGRRLFIRAMEENAHTNMTVVTNFRAYQFDLRSSSADAVFGSEELTYVVRFFYPLGSEPGANPAPYTLPSVMPTSMAPVPQPVITIAPTPTPAMAAAPPVMTRPAPPMPAPSSAKPYNYRYTFSGPTDTAPTKIYDDGKTTYFKLPGAQTPKFSIVTAKGESIPMPARRTSDGLIAVDAIAPRFSLYQVGRQVIVYNEATSGGR